MAGSYVNSKTAFYVRKLISVEEVTRSHTSFVLVMVNIKFSGGHSDRGGDDIDGPASHP